MPPKVQSTILGESISIEQLISCEYKLLVDAVRTSRKKQVKEYFRGLDIDIDLGRDDQPFLILKHGKDFFGCSKYKNKKLLNFLSKVHRTSDLMIQS